MKIAHTIEVTRDKVIIEGVEFDFYIDRAPEVELVYDGRLAMVTLSVYTDNVIVGDEVRHSTMDLPKADRQKIESEWVKREAKRIVHEDMAKVLEWLNVSVARDIMNNYAERHMAGLPNDSQATMITNSNTD